MSNNYKPEVLDKGIVRKSLERYYIRNTFDQNCTQLESGVCLLAERDDNLKLSLEDNYCWQLKELMGDYHNYRQNILIIKNESYLEKLTGIFEEEVIDILEFDCGHFDIADGLHRLCIATKSEVPAYATYTDKDEICPACESIKQRARIHNKSHLL
jgi:hypothetical protein